MSLPQPTTSPFNSPSDRSVPVGTDFLLLGEDGLADAIVGWHVTDNGSIKTRMYVADPVAQNRVPADDGLLADWFQRGFAAGNLVPLGGDDTHHLYCVEDARYSPHTVCRVYLGDEDEQAARLRPGVVYCMVDRDHPVPVLPISYDTLCTMMGDPSVVVITTGQAPVDTEGHVLIWNEEVAANNL